MTGRACQSLNQKGFRCRQAPLRDAECCFWHDPDTAEAATEARALGGRRARQEGAVAAIYGLDGVTTMADLARVLEVGILDALALENSNARGHTIARLLQVGSRIIEGSEMAQQVDEIHRILSAREG